MLAAGISLTSCPGTRFEDTPREHRLRQFGSGASISKRMTIFAMNDDKKDVAAPDAANCAAEGFVAAATLEQLRPGHLLRCTVGQIDILVCRPGRDNVFAIENRCSHLGKPLHCGRMIGFQLSCPEHGAEFDVRTGEALTFPAVRPIKTYPVDIRDGMIYVSVDAKPKS
jgi:3-phenylpropionate/trans-cinnamate dioxygenase ferredoxin component